MPLAANTLLRSDAGYVRPRLPRIVGIDVARSVAILLAMASHVWTASGTNAFIRGSWVDVLLVLMAAATPTFIILFGTMLELVYLPRFIPGQRGTASAKLLSRAVQCWLLYALSVAVLFVMHDNYSAMFSVATVMMLGVTPFTDILKFYAVVLALAPIMLWARCRFGLVALGIGAVAVHFAYPLLIALPTPTGLALPIEVNRLWKFLFGLGDAKLGGPSVMHGITMVIAGMAIGRFLVSASETQPDAMGLRRRAALLLAGAGLPLAVVFALVDEATLRDLGNMSLRIAGHPLYFFVGMLFACVLTAAAVLATSRGTSDRFWRDAAFLGRTSLFTFAFGNMLLYCIVFEPESRAEALWVAAALLVAIIALSFWFDRLMRQQGWVAHRVSGLQRRITALFETASTRLTMAADGQRPA